MLAELRKVIPSFLARVDRPDRGGEWSRYLARRRDEMDALVDAPLPARPRDGDAVGADATVTLVDFDPDGEDKVLAAMCYPALDARRGRARRARSRRSAPTSARAIVRAYVGERRNRRHRPGRAFERTDYRFDIVSDYGAFRDLQRHRMLTIEWQPLSTDLGYEVPELVAEAGLGAAYVESLERSRELHEALARALPAPGRLRRRARLPDPLRRCS